MSQLAGGNLGSGLERRLPDGTQELSQQEIRELLSALDLSQCCVRDLDGTVHFWSQGNCRLYGWSPEEAVGHITHDLLKTKFQKPLAEIQAELLRQGSWTGELRHVTKSGEQIWVASHWTLRRDRDGTPLSVIEVNNDVTDRKRAGETASYLASIVDASSDAIIGKDLSGVITSWNSGAERLFGYSAQEAIGRSILLLFPPELKDEELIIQGRLRRGQQVEGLETIRLSKAGRRIAVSLTSSPILNASGEVIGASKIVRDISERNALEAAFRESERRRRLATEAGELGLWSYDPNTRKTYWSSRCKTILGLPPGALTPSLRNSLRLLHRDDVDRVARMILGSFYDGVPFEIEFRVLHSNGEVRWVQVRGRPFASDNGEGSQLHGTILDLTRRKQTEEALKRSNSQLQQFAFAAAHDLQEPLRNVALSISLAKAQTRAALDPNSEALLDTATQSAQRMQDMVRALLSYSRVLHQEDEVWPVTDANEMLAAALSNLAREIEESGAFVTEDALPCVRMDQTHLIQLFQNLIGNAIKYRGSDPLRIHVGALRRQNFCELYVRDNGIGIAPQYQERVFGVFKRLRVKQASGTGIGLALCKRIVEYYGGDIWIESDGRNGTTFFFKVPSAELHGRVESKTVQPAAVATAGCESPGNGVEPTGNVLL